MLKKRKKRLELTRINIKRLKNQSCLNCKYDGKCNHISVVGFRKTLEDFCNLEHSGYDYFDKVVYAIV